MYGSKHVANAIYKKVIVMLNSELAEDRMAKNISDEQYKRLYKILDSFWIELHKVDIENGLSETAYWGLVLKA